jgi:hypothetical protein
MFTDKSVLEEQQPAFMFQAGKVVRETQYFAEPFEPPAWRARWVEPMT